jgi:hypothetical protein
VIEALARAKTTLLYVIEKIAEAAIRKAAGLPFQLDEIPLSLRGIAEGVVEVVAEQIAIDDGITLRCKLCGKGPFTRKGLYLHLRRVHIDVIEDLVRQELEDRLWRGKNIG